MEDLSRRSISGTRTVGRVSRVSSSSSIHGPRTDNLPYSVRVPWRTYARSISKIVLQLTHPLPQPSPPQGSLTLVDTLPVRPPSPSPSQHVLTPSLSADAISYDWSKGHNGNVPNHPNSVMIHTCTVRSLLPCVRRDTNAMESIQEDEVKKRPKK
jgi:hypothetical protein